MRIKRLLSLILAFLMVLSLPACSNQPAGSVSEPNSQNGETQNNDTKFPLEKPITIVSYYDPGGASDIAVRVLSAMAPSILGQRVDVLNMPGGGGLEAIDYVMKQPQDGYTLLLGDSILRNMYLTQDVPYELSDFDPFFGLSKATSVFFSKADGPYQSIQDIIDACKASPESVSVGHGRVGNGGHICLQILEKQADFQAAEVPTTGGAEALSFVLGGHTDAGVSTPTTLDSSLANGDIIALATTGAARWDSERLADVPTLKELGFDIVSGGNYYMMAYGDVPEDRLNLLYDAFKQAMESAPALTMCEASAIVPASEMTHEECVTAWNDELEMYTEYYRGTGELFER